MPCADAKCRPDWKCRDAATPEAVCLIARQLLFKGEAAEIFNCGSLKGLNVYRSEVDELGEMVYVCESENGIGLKELLSLLYRGFFLVRRATPFGCRRKYLELGRKVHKRRISAMPIGGAFAMLRGFPIFERAFLPWFSFGQLHFKTERDE